MRFLILLLLLTACGNDQQSQIKPKIDPSNPTPQDVFEEPSANTPLDGTWLGECVYGLSSNLKISKETVIFYYRIYHDEKCSSLNGETSIYGTITSVAQGKVEILLENGKKETLTLDKSPNILFKGQIKFKRNASVVQY